ncbi:hypothetical protein [Maribacter sp. 2307ULW6-5]
MAQMLHFGKQGMLRSGPDREVRLPKGRLQGALLGKGRAMDK